MWQIQVSLMIFPLTTLFLPEHRVLTGLTTLFLISTFSILRLLRHSNIRVAEIARSFWTNEEMGGSLRLDGVVCVVDSRNVLKVRIRARYVVRERRVGLS